MYIIYIYTLLVHIKISLLKFRRKVKYKSFKEEQTETVRIRSMEFGGDWTLIKMMEVKMGTDDGVIQKPFIPFFFVCFWSFGDGMWFCCCFR